MLLTALAVSTTSVVSAPVRAAGGGFTCSPGFYQVIAGQLKLLNPVTATYTNIGPAQPQYNAMGYNVADNFLYALSTNSGTQGDLLQIASDGSVTDLGLPTGLPAGSYVAGDFDNAGNLIVRNTATTWYSINVATKVAITLHITGAADAGNDLVWINGVIYLLNATTLYAVDLSTDVATMADVSGVVSGAFGAAWSDNPNELFFSDNNTGHIYKITGFTGASPAGTLELTGTVTSNNDGAACKNADSPFNLPTANDDAYTMVSNTTLVENAADGVLTNDVGTGLTAILDVGPTHGALTLNADGSFTYTPTAGFFGPDTFTYFVEDQFARESALPATVTITVNLPGAPVAVADSYTTTAGTAINDNAASGVLANDTGTGIAVTGNTGPSHGTLTLNGNGSFLYTPAAGYSGPDSFQYTITDSFSRTSTTTVSLTVNPVAENVTGSGTGPAAIVVTPSAPVGVGPFTYVLATTPPGADGTATMNSATGQITFTPAAGFHGAVPTFTYTVTDAASDVSAPATIDLTVNEPAAPVAQNDTYTMTANASLNVATSGVLTNDTGTGIIVTTNTSPFHGTLTLSGNGSFLYTPTSGYSGPDNFNYTLIDAYGRTSTATASIAIHPIAQDVIASGPGPGALQVTPSAPVGTGPFTFALLTTPPGADGTATMDPTTGEITFTPAVGFHGTLPTFTYAVTDTSSLVSAPATINLTIGTPTPPVANDVSGTTPANTPITVTPAAPTGTGPFTYALATTPPAGDGVASIDPTTGAITFTPAAGFSGIVPTFTYTVIDVDDQVSAPANVSIDVTPLDSPAAGSGPPGDPITVQPPAPVGTGPFTYHVVPSSLPPPADGTITINPTTGAITFTPAPGFTGSVTVQYTVTDSDGLTSPAATVTFSVAATSTTVPTTGAVETPMLIGFLLLGVGLLLIAGAATGRLVRRRRFLNPA
jgi:hypothetical protein